MAKRLQSGRYENLCPAPIETTRAQAPVAYVPLGEDPRAASAAEGAKMSQVFLEHALPKTKKLFQEKMR